MTHHRTVRTFALAIALASVAAVTSPACAPKLPDGDACVERRNTLLAAFDAGTFADIDCPAARDAGLPCNSECGSPENCGNELGVGMHCSVGGGECQANGFSAAFLCILDQRPDEFPVCTKPCKFDDECGSGAFCASENPGESLAGCLPRNCAPDHAGSPRPDAGSVDAGAVDAGAVDAGAVDAGAPDPG